MKKSIFITLSIAVVAISTLFFTNGSIQPQPQHEDVQTVASRGSSGG
ncbi:hypothetical protein ABDA29_02120 [Bacillus pumilus]|nr:hypothetical protein [Bacillus pumilus]MDR0121774.1 hypothetical protein [Bacillus pumilus]